jgi:PAC2 family
VTTERPAFRLHEVLPALDAPVFVAMLSGWIDASAAGAAAIATVEAAIDARPLATFDSDQFIDYRARRPTMELREGVNQNLVWPAIELKVGRSAAGEDIVVLSGPEPDSAWQAFADAATDLSIELGVRMAVFLGAYPFATPHTRPSRLSCSSPSAELLATVPFLRNSVDVPAGMGAVLEHRFAEKGVPSIGLWAQVPHYLGTMAYPAAAVALLDGLESMTGVAIGRDTLEAEAQAQRQRVDQLVDANPEHRSMIHQLEAIYDAGEPAAGAGITGFEGAIPSGDDIAAEFERFLRDQGS